MLNHFRTKLLNLPYEVESEHIPRGYISVNLDSQLIRIYEALFPVGCSRYYKLFLAHKYLNMLDASGYTPNVLAYDNRVSYSLTDTQFFKINRISNPKISDIRFPLFVNGKLESNKFNKYYFESIKITQIANTDVVSIYSIPNGVYYDRLEAHSSSSEALVSLTVSGSITDEVQIGQTGLSFLIGLGGNFKTTPPNKTWQFVTEAPFEFDLQATIDRLEATSPFTALAKYGVDVESYHKLWESSENNVIKLSALLLAYVAVVDTI